MIADIRSVDAMYNGDTVAITIVLDGYHRQAVYNTANEVTASEKPYTLCIEKKKQKRSMNANAYLWTICQKIAEKVGTTKETVYQKNISEVGSFEVVEVAAEAAKRFIDRWQSNGIGWVAENIGERNGYATIVAYYGSSTYDTAEMARLIDAIVAEAKTVGVETMTPIEIERLKDEWRESR